MSRYSALHPDGTPYRAEEYPLVRTLARGRGGQPGRDDLPPGRGQDHYLVGQHGARAWAADGRYYPWRSQVFYDISERKAMEEALRAAKEQADRASQAKSRFLACASRCNPSCSFEPSCGALCLQHQGS